MSNNKSQHFVPQFYLRHFSADGKSIGVFNLRRQKAIPIATLENQACKDWFYGTDLKAERSLSGIEGVAAKIFSKIITTGYIPSRFSFDHHALISFIALQRARTEAAESESNEQTDKLGKMFLKHVLTKKDPDLLKFLPKVKITDQGAVAENMKFSLIYSPLLYDLNFKLIQNETDIAFITSDAPVVMHNQLVEKFNSSTLIGYTNTGLQIWMPISPDKAIIFYDSAAYDVGGSHSRLIIFRNPSHVQQLNEFQWELAYKNLYFSPKTDPVKIAEDAKTIIPKKEPGPINIDETHIIDGNRKGVLLNLGRNASFVKLKIPLIRINTKIPKGTEKKLVHSVRHPDWVAFVRNAAEQFEAGNITFQEFSYMTSKVPTKGF